jgi:hypothetical protein
MSSVGPVSEEWSKLQTLVIAPMEDNLNSGLMRSIARDAYVNTYTVCYQLCLGGDDNCIYLYKHCTEVCVYSSQFDLQFIYFFHQRIESYLRAHVFPALQQLTDESLLEEFVRREQNHKVMMRWYNMLFQYLSKNFIPKFHMDPLQVVGDVLYRDIVFHGLQHEVAHAALKLIEKRRNGILVNTGILKSVIEVFCNGKIYEDVLEASIILKSRENFRVKASQWIAMDSTAEYVLKVDQVIDEVKGDSRVYLPASTEPKLLNAINMEFLLPYTTILAEKETGCYFLFQNDRFEDLGRLARLFQKVHADALIWEVLRVYLTTLIEAEVRNFEEELEGGPSGSAGAASSSTGAAPSGKEKETNKDKELQASLKLVPALIDLLKKYTLVVKEFFRNSPPFQKAIKDAFGAGLRTNGKSHAILTALVTFCDTILRKQQGGSDENQAETQLDIAVSMLAFMEEKDYFIEVYRNQLSKRSVKVLFRSCHYVVLNSIFFT